MELRKGAPSDARALAELAERTFRETFERSNSAENMESYCAAVFGEAIQRRELADPSVTTLVCESDGAFVAFAQLRWSRAPECVGSDSAAEIHRLYVERAWHGRGVAQRLMTELLTRAAAGGATCVWLGVWEHNPRARAFYEKCGFVEAGHHVFQMGTDAQRDLVLVRKP